MMIFESTPYDLSVVHVILCFILSNAIWKSMNKLYIFCSCLYTFSANKQCIIILCTVFLCFLKPACSSQRSEVGQVQVHKVQVQILVLAWIYLYLYLYLAWNTCTWICLRNKSLYSHKLKTFIQLLDKNPTIQQRVPNYSYTFPKTEQFCSLKWKIFRKRNTFVLLWEYFGTTVRKRSICRNDNFRRLEKVKYKYFNPSTSISTSTFKQVQVLVLAS